jgi:hypothetical protein
MTALKVIVVDLFADDLPQMALAERNHLGEAL